ncbi:MAG: DUF1667 domain-containing protein [Planctomycetia bacterium]|nr:DUF1667 domain-containing protein [Planctomycetia bacterium]
MNKMKTEKKTKTELICIVCPRGCRLKVDENLNVTGNSCKRGETYGKNEVTNPTRVITSTVRVEGGKISRLPVKTASAIPKEKIEAVMEEIHKLRVSAPIVMNEILIPNLLETGIPLIATRTVKCEKKK